MYHKHCTASISLKMFILIQFFLFSFIYLFLVFPLFVFLNSFSDFKNAEKKISIFSFSSSHSHEYSWMAALSLNLRFAIWVFCAWLRCFIPLCSLSSNAIFILLHISRCSIHHSTATGNDSASPFAVEEIKCRKTVFAKEKISVKRKRKGNDMQFSKNIFFLIRLRSRTISSLNSI